MKEQKVLLMYPPSQLMEIETPRPDGSLGPLYLAGALEGRGIEVDILDATVGAKSDRMEDTFYNAVMQQNGLIRVGMSLERIGEYITKGQYTIVGINSNFTAQTRMVLEVARVAKEANPNILVVAGGVNARNIPNMLLENGHIDIICTTEGEKVFCDIVERCARGNPWNDVDGIIYGSRGLYTTNSPKSNSIIQHMDSLPFPAWHKLPFEKYEKISSPHGAIGGKAYRYAPMMTSRGCPFECTYCYISLEKIADVDIGSLRFKSIDRVMQEIEILKNLGVKKIFIEDDSLLAKKARVKEIFWRLHGAGLEIADVNGVNLIHFAIGSKSGKFTVDREYLELLVSAGFNQIVFPVESANQRIVDKYATGKLNHERFDVVELVRIAREVGIVCPINMMIGFPDESLEEMLQSVELGKRLMDAGAEYVTFFIPIPFPSCTLFNTAIREGYLDPNFDPDKMNWKHTIMRNTVVAPERIEWIRDWAWRLVNTKEHVDRRLKESALTRWNSSAVA